MKAQLYYSGETLNIGLKWTDLEKESVDVSGATDIVVTLVHRPMKQLVASYSKAKGTMTVSEDKCVITISGDTTKDLEGLYDIYIEMNSGGVVQKAQSDVAIHFVKPNN